MRSFAGINSNEGIGVSEALCVTLIHHYKVDRDGLVTWANLIIATGHNNLAMNRGVLQAAHASSTENASRKEWSATVSRR